MQDDNAAFPRKILGICPEIGPPEDLILPSLRETP